MSIESMSRTKGKISLLEMMYANLLKFLMMKTSLEISGSLKIKLIKMGPK